jgi:hypothetical protein
MTSLSSPTATILDFNRENIAATDVNAAINALLDAAALTEQREERRTYLGASGIGSECLRKVQYDWQCDSVHAARTKRIFSRGHMFEEITVKALAKPAFGWSVERRQRTSPLATILFRGHADGIIVAGPAVPGMTIQPLGAQGARLLGLEEDREVRVAQGLSAVFRPVPALHGLSRAGRKPGAVHCGQLRQLRDPASAGSVRSEAAQAASDRAVLSSKRRKPASCCPASPKRGQTDWRCKMCSHKEFCWSAGLVRPAELHHAGYLDGANSGLQQRQAPRRRSPMARSALTLSANVSTHLRRNLFNGSFRAVHLFPAVRPGSATPRRRRAHRSPSRSPGQTPASGRTTRPKRAAT